MNKERGAMTPQQVFGNWLATKLIELFYGVKYTDLGPFRAIRYDKSLPWRNAIDTSSPSVRRNTSFFVVAFTQHVVDARGAGG